MSHPPATSPTTPSTADTGLAPAMPIMVVVFVAFLVIGMALPVLPLHVHHVLGFGPSMVGVVAGGQFIAALLSRFWAGSVADTRGAKLAVTLGLVAAVIGGLFYFISLRMLEHPAWSVSVLLVGRTLVGGAESLIITGGMLWGLGLVPSDRSAKVIAWVGMAMFAALAVGAPLGSAIFSRFTFLGIAVATIALPLLSLAVIAPLAPLVPEASDRGCIRDVLRPVLLPGLGFALSGITFGAVTAFLTLYFSVQGWANGALAFTIFAVALIVARIAAGHLPDRFGGARVALWCLGIQAIGLLMIGLAGSGELAMVGAAIAGAGFSLVFPSLGLEAVRRAPRAARAARPRDGHVYRIPGFNAGLGQPCAGMAGRSGRNWRCLRRKRYCRGSRGSAGAYAAPLFWPDTARVEDRLIIHLPGRQLAGWSSRAPEWLMSWLHRGAKRQRRCDRRHLVLPSAQKSIILQE